MAFQRSLQDIVNEQSRNLQRLEQQLQLVALRVSQSATRMSVSMIQTIMGRLRQYTSHMAGQIGRDFRNMYREISRETMGHLTAVSRFISEIDNRTERLSERQTRGWTRAAAAQRALMHMNHSIAEQLQQNYELEIELQNRLLTATTLAEARMAQRGINRIRDLNAELIAARDNAAELGNQMRALEFQENMQGLKERAFGGLYNLREKVAQGANFATHLFRSPAALATAVAAGIALIFKFAWQEMRKGLQEFRDAGQLPSQWMKSFEQARRTVGTTLKRGLVMDAEEAAKSLVALQKILANIEVPGQLRNESAFLSKMYELTNEESAQFVARMYRFHHENAERVLSISNYVQSFSKANNLVAKDVIEDMNRHAEDFAKAGSMSAEAFARATQHARRLGYEMTSITSLADQLVGDFEGALKTQAELTTVFPGMDMSEVMYASQFGNNEQIAESVKEMLDMASLDFNNMPRSFKLSLTRNLGLSATELAQMTGTKAEEWVTPDQRDQVGFREAVMKSMFDLTGGIKEIIKLLGAIVMIVNPIYWLSKAVKPNMYRTSTREDGTEVNYTPGMSVIKRPGRDLTRGDIVFSPAAKLHTGGIVGIHGQPVSLAWKKYHTGLLPNEVPAILQKGEAVLTPKMLTNLSGMVDSMYQARNTVANAPTAPNVVTESVILDTERLEELLRQLINVTKDGKIVTMQIDGREVGKAIVSANTRNG